MRPIRHEDHSDSIDEKLRLFERAHAAGDHDLAMSLAESIKDTLTFLRQYRASAAAPDTDADSDAPVESLPAPWASWARGWSRCRPITLFEGVGIARSPEPVDWLASFPVEQTTDLRREVRVARVEANGSLREVPSQVHGETRRGKSRLCRLTIHADVPLHGQATYLIFHGNPYAELPDYATDLEVKGDGYGLDISNRHYVAGLSRQMGQLERLVYRRQHGLELYAGGKGHGEPPTIDWAHDYVDAGGFQKLRIKDWARCPNHEVVRGPLRVSVRRWGFPHSPVHPVFTPSRIHVDVTYTFHAGLPYFFKESRIDAVKDVDIEAMRDDEWVFSGYSFTNAVWIDGAGKLHEGAVPAARSNDLWGVGFYHRDSRDAFIALWLEHEARNHEGIQHGGAPTLDYPGHGQLWSRYPVNKARLKAGASFRQRNAYLVAPYPNENAAESVERLRHRLLHPLEASAGQLPAPDNAKATGALARPGETAAAGSLKDAVWKTLREVKDEQLYTADLSVVDLGLVHDVRVDRDTVRVLLTMPHRGRPEYRFFVTQGGGRVSEGIRERVSRLRGVADVVVDFTWYPEWSLARLTDDARLALGLPPS